jgi:hypothetical protein
VALPFTLHSLRTEDFDGLNFFYQIPFALPWALLPIQAVFRNYEVTAYFFALMGLVNAVLLYFWLRRCRRNGSGSPDKVPVRPDSL